MSRLVELYIKEITEGRMTLEEVPAKLQEAVEEEQNKVIKEGE